MKNENDSLHFIRYTLAVVLDAYKTFEERVVNVSLSKKNKFEQIKELFDLHLEKLTKAKISEYCPDISTTTIELYLHRLVKEKYINKIGDKKDTSYIKNHR
jgi:predicted HTH transcriptional regulator